MLTSSRSLTALILAGSVLAVAPVCAHDIVVRARPTFRDIEFDDGGSNRVALAKATLDARIPEGTATGIARAIVRSEGAHCGVAVADGQTRCTFGSFEGIDDHLHDVVWTIRLNSVNGRIANLNLARESIGS